MLNDAQVQAYLDRLGFEGEPRIDEETLNELILRHQSSIPFETVVLHRSGNVPSLDVDDVYTKLIEKRLGGYCFELNKGFQELLTALGFNVRPALGRAVRGRETKMPINHRGAIVRIGDDDYSADVGFGGPMPAGALKLEDGLEQDIRGELYTPYKTSDSWWNVDRITKSTADLYDDNLPVRRQTELALCTAEVDEIDFDALNQFCAQPGTLFHEHELVNLRTQGGYYALMDKVLTKRINGQKEVIELQSIDEVNEVLAEIFGMTNV